MNVLEKIGLKYLINKLSSKFVTKAYLDSQLGMTSDLEARINSVENLVKIQNSSSGWFNIPEIMYDTTKFNPTSSTDGTLNNGAYQLCFFGSNHLRTRGSFRNKTELDISSNYLPIFNIPEDWLDDRYGVYVRGGSGSRILKFMKGGDEDSDGTIKQNYLYQYINNGTAQTNLSSGSWIPLGNLDYYLTESEETIILDADYAVACDFTVGETQSTGFIYLTQSLSGGTQYPIGTLVDSTQYLQNLTVSPLNDREDHLLSFNVENNIIYIYSDYDLSKGTVFNLYTGGTWNGF